MYVLTCMWTTQKLAGPILRDFLFLPLKIPNFLYSPIPFYRENQKALTILLLSFHPETQHISHFGISPLLTFGGPGFSASGFYTPTFGKLSYLFPFPVLLSVSLPLPAKVKPWAFFFDFLLSPGL